MPKRSTVFSLPAAARVELDRRLAEGSFSDYTGLVEWLDSKGFAISRSALHRYGSELERRIDQVREATMQAEALVAAAPDDAGAMADASLRLVQEKIFELMLAAEDGDLKSLSAAARALAESARAGTSIRQERRRVLREAAQAATQAARKAGLSKDTAEKIRTAVEEAGQ